MNSTDQLKLFSFTAIFFFCLSLTLSAQDTTDYFKSGFIRYSNFIYKPGIHTVQLERNNEPLSDAVIILNSSQQLHLGFDDLTSESANYFYKFIHCDFNWEPSSLQESDYTDGFFYEQVPDMKPSFNTYQVYYHYSAVFPTAQMRITKSGNYIIMVYDNNDPENPVITWRFRVAESAVSINSTIHRASVIDQRSSSQEIDFTIDYGEYPLQNPYADLKIVLQQNGRWDNCITNLKPLFMKAHELDYNYDTENVFNGGNEFRNFDTRSLRYTTPYVEKITQNAETTLYEVLLRNDENKSFQRYSIIDDINGKFLIKTYDGRNDQTECDYTYVTFRLKYPDPLANGNFYVFGELTHWSLDPKAKMVYDYNNNEYTCTLLLKQGYYNYQYLWAEDAKKAADETAIEGNHFETENDYFILVYLRDPFLRYDRLIGLKKINTRNIY